MKTNQEVQKKKSRKIELLIFGFFLLLNFATSGGHEYAFDDLLYFMHAENLALNQSMLIHPYKTPSAWDDIFEDRGEFTLRDQQEKYFRYQEIPYDEKTPLAPFGSASSLLLPFLTIPLYYSAIIFSLKPVTVLTFFSNSIILSLVSLMIFKSCLVLFSSKKISFVLSLVFMITTFVWSYNTGMMLRPLAALLVVLGFYFLISINAESKFKPMLAAFCIGFSLLASSSSIILLPGLFVFGIFRTSKNKNQIILFVASFILIMIIQALINDSRFGSFSDFGFGGFQGLQTHQDYEGLYGYFTSLAWGVPIHFPLFVFFPIALFLIWKKDKSQSLLFLYCFAATLFFYGTLPVPGLWQGAPGWGPRYFTTILPLLVISLGFVINQYNQKKIFKISFIGFAGFGFFMSLMGKLVWAIYGFYTYGEGVMKSNLIANRMFLHSYNLEYTPLNFHLQVLKEGYMERFVNGSGGGLAPCNYDLYVLCKIGEFPFILLLIGCGFLAFLVIRELYKSKFQSTMSITK